MLAGAQRKSSCLAGRIGVEFDVPGVICAQVTKRGQVWQLAHGRVFESVDRLFLPSSNEEPTLPFRPTELVRAAAGMRGSELACVLPMDCCDLRVMELPSTKADELEQMVRHEVEGVAGQNSSFDFWRLPPGLTSRNELTGVCVLSVERHTIREAVQGVLKSGFTAAGIDGLPTACARAMTLMGSASDAGSGFTGPVPRLGIHLGWNRTLLILERDGIPVLARVPQVGGVSRLVHTVASQMGLTASESFRILRGISRKLPVRLTDRLQRQIRELIRDWALSICEESLRSISFAKRPGFRAVPSRCILMGYGSSLPQLPELIQSELNIQTAAWSIPSQQNCEVLPEFAVAAALSVWEIEE